MSSTLRNSVQRRNHKERGQLVHRQRFGLLEKKKDYKLRAKDYHGKQNRLKAMRTKALFKNPDEFYFKMINTKTKGGVHIQERNEKLPDEMVQLMKSQDKNYIKLQRDISKKKLEKLQQSIHFLDDAPEGEEDIEEEKTSQHIVFVDNDKKAKKFNPAKHLDTLPELVHRKFNRPRLETLRNATLDTLENKQELKEIKRERERKYLELSSRTKREEDLARVERELQLQRAMQQKGKKKKIGVDSHGLAIYKWSSQRKK
ncbi:small-subunit processome [Spinellus fusiger]|nr:small-subunit processome [Spinellus fusiger]